MNRNLYHYTSNEALIEIVNHDCLRLSHFYFQNDPRELRYGLDLLLEHKDEIEQICPDANEYIETIGHEKVPIYELPIFTFSLSQEDDLLSQWRGYGSGNKSVCIGFIKDDLTNVKPRINKNILRISKIVYDENAQKNRLMNFFKRRNRRYKKTKATLLNLLANPSNYAELINILIEFKHHRWNEEQEWRLIASFGSNSIVSFLGGSKWLKPYIDLKYEKIPISNIKIPRSGYESKNKSSIECLLKAKGQKGINVYISDIPIVY